jgi:hypothetical protein
MDSVEPGPVTSPMDVDMKLKKNLLIEPYWPDADRYVIKMTCWTVGRQAGGATVHCYRSGVQCGSEHSLWI